MRTRVCLALALLAVSAVGGSWLVRCRKPKDEPARRLEEPPPVIGGLTVDAARLDLGEVWEGVDAALELPVRNTTGARVQVAGFQASCGCASVETKSLAIPAFSTASVHLKADLTTRRGHEIGQAQRPFAFDISPTFSWAGRGGAGRGGAGRGGAGGGSTASSRVA